MPDDDDALSAAYARLAESQDEEDLAYREAMRARSRGGEPS